MATARAARAVSAIGMLMALLSAAAAGADLTSEMYHAAVASPHLAALGTPEELDALIGHERPAAAVAVMLHERSCHVCHSALPEFADVAKAFKEADIDMHFAHLECSGFRDAIKRKAHLRGFPSILVFRRREGPLSEVKEPSLGLIEQTVTITDDRGFLLRASRMANMAEDKDLVRLRHLGKEAQVVDVDLLDGTAKLAVPQRGGGGGSSAKSPPVWFPLEALRAGAGTAAGASPIFRRAEAAKSYEGSWKAKEMKLFLQRMASPLVAEVTSSAAALEAVVGERYPAFFFCGPGEVTLGFLEAAAKFQGKVRAYHAKDVGACPVPASHLQRSAAKVGDRDRHVLVYAPPGALWSPAQETVRAAVAIAGPEIVADDVALAEWLSANHLPGITELSFHNFWDFLNAGRPGLLVALQNPRTPLPDNKLALQKLHEVAKPVALNERIEVFTYSEGSYNLAVVDGTIPGLDTFGVSPERLPRVVLFEGPHVWVEDEDELTVRRLDADLEKLPGLWRSSNDAMGRARSLLRGLGKFYRYWDGLVLSALGGHAAGRLVLPVALAGMAVLVLAAARSVVASILDDGDEAPADGAGKKTQ